MAGRARKNTPRYPSGEVKREPDGYHPIAVKRLVDASIAKVSDARFGTPLGRMHLDGRLNAAEYSAGMRWDALRREYLLALEVGSPDPKSAVLEPARGSEPDPDSYLGMRIAKKNIAAVKEFQAAQEVLDRIGSPARMLVRRLCEGKGQSLYKHEEYIAVKAALKVLSQYFADEVK